MRVPRLYLDAELVLQQPATLNEEQTHRLTRVLRLRPQAAVCVFNGRGDEYECSLQRDGRQWQLLPVTRNHRPTQSRVHITLAQSITRSERMDFALQKAVELGVACIQPILAQRSSFKPQAKRLQNRRAHWQQIVVQACEQCGRTDLPQLLEPRESLAWMAENGTAIMLCADAETPLSQLAPDTSGTIVLVGPEGGFSDDERDAARALDIATASLGPRTLRTETAALVALTVLQTRFGDLAR